jgi:hypothetical protein
MNLTALHCQLGIVADKTAENKKLILEMLTTKC